MKEKTIYASDLHFDHKVWRNEMTFFKEELQLLQSRLDEIAARNTAEEATKGVESLQNRLIRQNEVADELLHDINANAAALEFFIKEHPVAIERVHFNDHTTLRDKVETYKKLYGEFKQSLLGFCTEWM
jgi:hypothetical protein